MVRRTGLLRVAAQPSAGRTTTGTQPDAVEASVAPEWFGRTAL